ncbi:Gfo/Idh/MocA family protein [Aestuariimicrobium ganziense]|uniref:Gfo/Idh/MocA family protein n=1 Tax=Aestuariimicrobium ganziense TaxID=2773677 RepID=UPI0019444BF6|nr:Gfo/Idh/MocA family oxidoreductase [Aestuariimicrobium ganziense]
MTTERTRIGIQGCGVISPKYLSVLMALPAVEITAVCDLVDERAQRASQVSGAPVLDPAEFATSDAFDILLDLTEPANHHATEMAGLQAGKHVYCEKPQATTFALAGELLDAADQKGVRLGTAPDTVLGTGTQTARATLDSGRIGEPRFATAFMAGGGPDLWHPGPDFFFQFGGGPMWDMGPYNVAALVNLLGPIVQVSALTSGRGRDRRPMIGPHTETTFTPEVPTHVSASLLHASGVVTTLIESWDAFGGTNLPHIEVYGTEGSMSVPDPNTHDGDVKVRARGDWELVEPWAGVVGAERGIGVADMAAAIRDGRPHRCSAELGHHAVEVMEAVVKSGEERRFIDILSTCQRPEGVPLTPLAEWGL